ncbi:ATP-binding protein [Methylobacterium sp. WL6]|uniref:ATP-binding protein n=1 Tax=Methylobacterium sp. WL6 TaxID=2603901 RepID=UPI0011C7F976|nr:ATP-binding protein [Methylobacterium sp. WL6]TXN72848.1 ATP-binding protein [Methylobacterium sp. WL6]
MKRDSGKLVAGVGLPGSGKTSVLSATAKLLGCNSFLEPEENGWDRAVMQRDVYGLIGALHWFRSQRVPNLIDARKIADDGDVVFLDTFYDKLCVHYLGKPGMEWLIPTADKYFENFYETAKIDYETLPDAEIVVFFDVKKTDWEKMLGKRGRQLDRLINLLDSYHTTQLFRNAAERYCEDSKATLIIFDNNWSTVADSAARLADILKKPLAE